MGVLVEVLDPLGVERAGSPDQAVDYITLRKEQFRQIGTVLASDAGDQCRLRDLRLPLRILFHHNLSEYQYIQVGAQEAIQRLVRRAHDWLILVERGVQEDGDAR